jgi:hypothetical protein
MKTVEVTSDSDLVRHHASEVYLAAARRRREATISVNVGAVHKALGLSNRVPLVCAALGSKKFLTENGLRLISKTGPPSGLSTTVTYTYEFVETTSTSSSPASQNAWTKLRGSLKDVYAELGGGEAYLRAERSAFRPERNSK